MNRPTVGRLYEAKNGERLHVSEVFDFGGITYVTVQSDIIESDTTWPVSMFWTLFAEVAE